MHNSFNYGKKGEWCRVMLNGWENPFSGVTGWKNPFSGVTGYYIIFNFSKMSSVMPAS